MIEETKSLPGVYLEIEIISKNEKGELLNYRKEIGHSFVRNFMKMLFAKMRSNEQGLILHDFVSPSGGNTARTGLIFTTGSGYNADNNTAYFACTCPAASTAYGILIGTDNGAIDAKAITNYRLGALIPHDASAPHTGKMSYGVHSVVGVSISGSDSFAGISRSIINNSGFSIGINEVGLFCTFATNTWYAGAVSYYLLARDILSSTFTAVDGASLTISYRVKATV